VIDVIEDEWGMEVFCNLAITPLAAVQSER